MNKNTQRLKEKGYTIGEFVKAKGISLRTYRRYEKEDSPFHAMLNRLIDELESKR